MHNRVRMIAASFLCKHLLIHWKKGESYFAKKLLDYEMASTAYCWCKNFPEDVEADEKLYTPVSVVEVDSFKFLSTENVRTAE